MSRAMSMNPTISPSTSATNEKSAASTAFRSLAVCQNSSQDGGTNPQLPAHASL